MESMISRDPGRKANPMRHEAVRMGLAGTGKGQADSGGFFDATTADAGRAGLDSAGGAIDLGTHELQVWLKGPRRDGRHVLTDTALFLGLTATMDGATPHAAFSTNITYPRHN
jgi:hypothetical protein